MLEAIKTFFGKVRKEKSDALHQQAQTVQERV
jgi:hypothetical protein